MIAVSLLKALIVRATLVLHALLSIWRVTVTYDDNMWWLLAIGLLPFALETFYTLFKRHGKEFLWFTPCFFNYLLVCVPCVWLLEIDKSQHYIDGTEEELERPENSTLVTGGLDINPAMWNLMVEELMLYILIIGRWLLPRGKVTREMLSDLLFAFLGIAADIMEMFSLFGEEDIRVNMYMGYWILSVWSVSVLQFTITITVTHQRRARRVKYEEHVKDDDKDHEARKMRNEILVIILSMMMQDVPFVVLRMYAILTYNLVTYSLIFFTAKNFLVIMLLFYRIAVICQKRYCPDPEEDEEEDDEEVVVGGSNIDKKKMMAASKGHKPTVPRDSLMLFVNEGKKNGARQAEKDRGKHRVKDKADLKKRNIPPAGRKGDPRVVQGQARQTPGQVVAMRNKDPASGDAKHTGTTLPQESGMRRAQREPTARSGQSSDGDFDSINTSPSTTRSYTASVASRKSQPPNDTASNAPLISTPTRSQGEADDKRSKVSSKSQPSTKEADTPTNATSSASTKKPQPPKVDGNKPVNTAPAPASKQQAAKAIPDNQSIKSSTSSKKQQNSKAEEEADKQSIAPSTKSAGKAKSVVDKNANISSAKSDSPRKPTTQGQTTTKDKPSTQAKVDNSKAPSAAPPLPKESVPEVVPLPKQTNLSQSSPASDKSPEDPEFKPYVTVISL